MFQVSNALGALSKTPGSVAISNHILEDAVRISLAHFLFRSPLRSLHTQIALSLVHLDTEFLLNILTVKPDIDHRHA
jgi:hypothetical protein